MYVIAVNKQNRNQNIFSIIVLWKQLLPKQTETECASFTISTWWYHYIFKDNTFILYPNNKLAFSPASKKSKSHIWRWPPCMVLWTAAPRRLRQASHSKFSDFFVQFMKRKWVLWTDGCIQNCIHNYKNFSTMSSKGKIQILYFQNHCLCPCPSCYTTQLILLIPALFPYISDTFLSSTDCF